ncbi:putative acetyltransferase [Morus notabilis]|uniref:Putative acetyltransferase n=2 Tax=Morus notabilis TaxID=981085 RepID=W9S6D4_9ROSA|nr:putative acetyltransferase [Morus notabilis]
MDTTPTVNHISECFIKPHYTPEDSKNHLYLTPWDLAMLSVHYIQKGLLFAKPPHTNKDENFMESLLDRLKQSLSVALVHFYPLAGRLKTVKTENPNSYSVHVDCNDSPGAKFIYATLGMTVSDILSPIDVPPIVQSFFDHDKAVNHDGHTTSLVTIQVTELVDGVFIGCSMNHIIADGTSFWNFWNMWSEIFRAKDNNDLQISRPPIFKRWFPEGHGPILSLPYRHPNEFIGSFEAPKLRERVFHFSAESLAKLKASANLEYNTSKISSLQSLSALVWRSITRVRNLPPDQVTSCRISANNRARLDPPISENYFGNAVYIIRGFTTAGELLQHDLGWAAWKLHEAVVNHNDKSIRGLLDAWLKSPCVYQLRTLFDPHSVIMGSSPRFNKYGNEFGMGKALALRSGYANKFDGCVYCYPGHEGGGSIDLEMSLSPETMRALESDEEFMEAAGLSHL